MRALRSTATKERAFTKSAKVPSQKKLDTRVKLAAGFGPRHGENSLEGETINPKMARLQGGEELVKHQKSSYDPASDTTTVSGEGLNAGEAKFLGMVEDVMRARTENDALRARLSPEQLKAYDDEQGHAKGTSDVLHLAGGLGDVYAGGGGSYTPQQLALLNKMQQGQYDYTFGPGSPNATPEDLQTYVGGKYSPAGGFARHGGWALAPKDYYSFTKSQRRQHDIMDIAPANQAGKLERYFAAGRHGFGGGGRMDRTEPGSSGGYIGLGEPSPQGFAGYSPPDWGRQDYGGSVGVGGFGGDYAPGAYTGYVDSYGNPTSDAYGAPKAMTPTQDFINQYANAPGGMTASSGSGGQDPVHSSFFQSLTTGPSGGSNTGAPTQRGIGAGLNLLNLVFPGLGAAAKFSYFQIMNQVNKGQMTPQQGQQAIKALAQKTPAMPSGSVSLPTHQQGGGFDPYGNPARGRQYWSSDFGRGPGGPDTKTNLGDLGSNQWNGAPLYGATLPGGNMAGGFYGGHVGNFGTAIGFGGSFGGGSNAGYLGPSAAGMNRPYTAQEWGALPGSKKYAAPILTGAEGGATPRMGYQQYLSMWHPSGGGVGVGFGKQSGLGHTPKLAQFAEGVSDVSDEEYAQQLSDDFERNLSRRRFKPKPGKHFDPRDVPIFEGPRGHFYDPHYGRDDKYEMAAKGKHTVQAVQGNTDTVPAMLTPHEAVLNVNASELAGRDNIEDLNKEGNKLAAKGIDLSKGKHMKRQKLQAGGEVDPLTMYKNKLGGGPQPYGAPQAAVGGGTPNTPQPFPLAPEPSIGGGPYQTPPGYGQPHQGQYGGVGRNNYFRHQQRSGSFFPGRGGQGFAGGTADLQAQADPFWKGSDLPQLAAGKIDLEALKKHAQQNGMTAEQISGIVKAMQGMGGGTGYGSAADMATAPTGAGYQYGATEIGYPPFVAPGAEYHADKGSNWIGPYDPAYIINRQL